MTQKELITIINDKKDEMKMVASEQKTEFFAERTLLQETYLPLIQALEAEIAEIEAAEGDATEKIAELEALRTEFHDALSELRLAYQADGEALRQENQLQKQTRRQEHQAEVDAFHNQMEQRRRERQSAIEDYQEDPTTEPDTTEPDTTEPTTTSPETGGNDSQQGTNS
jgi:peptidoglycan hydrolase CwlO-like protein